MRTGGKSAVSCGNGAGAGKIGAEAGAVAMPNVLLLWISPTAALLGAARPLTWASSGAAVVGTGSCFVSVSSGAAGLSPDFFPAHECCASAVSNESRNVGACAPQSYSRFGQNQCTWQQH